MHLSAWLWLAAIVLFGAVEAATSGLVSLWFAIGAAAALAAALLHASVNIQLVLFAAVSAIALAATRPLARRYAAVRPVPTNLDRAVGGTGTVVEAIDNASGSGAVYVDGKTWTARSAGGGAIPAGARVRIERMEGVKLFVREENAEVVL